MRFLSDLWSARELLGNLVLRETRGQYKRTALGRLWSLANPLALMAIYTFIFSMVFRISPDPGDPSGLNIFPIWLLCGLLPWTFFSLSLNAAANSLLVNAGLISKVYFPRSVLPLAAIGTTGMNWLIEMGVLVAALLIIGAHVLPWIPGVLLFMLLLAMFVSGLGWILALATVYFRDVQYLLSLVLQLWMYLTPIIYPVSLVRDLSAQLGGLLGSSITLLDVYSMNPLFHFVAAFRQLLYDNRWPDTIHLVSCVLWAGAAVVVGALVFQRRDKKIAELI